MKKLLKPALTSLSLFILGFGTSTLLNTSAQDQVVYELRTYTATRATSIISMRGSETTPHVFSANMGWKS